MVSTGKGRHGARHNFTVATEEPPKKKIGRKRALPPPAARYIRRAFVLRRKLTDKALAARFGISTATVTKYGLDRHKDTT